MHKKLAGALVTAGLLACLQVSPPADAAPPPAQPVVSAKPTPSPTSTGASPRRSASIASGQTPRRYKATKRGPSGLDRRLLRAAPRFGAGEKVVSAWRSGRLSTDLMVRYAALNVVHRSAVPSRWRNARQLGSVSGLYYGYVLSQAAKASQATQRWLRKLATPTRAARAHVTSPVPRRAAAAAPQAAAADAPGDLAAECAQTTIIFLYDFICEHRTDHFAIYYNLRVVRDDGTVEAVGLPDVDTDGNGLPDGLDAMSEGLESAYATYTAMGYQVDTGGSPLLVMVGVDDGGASSNSAITLPTGLSETGGAPFIMLNSDPGADNYNYLPRHEPFHAFQYHYIPLDHLLADLGSVNWWMEATAEWAAHRSYLADPAAARDHPVSAQLYARTLDAYLGAPGRALNAWDGLAAARQYGAFPVAQFLTEYTQDDAAVLHTWQQLGETLPLESIENVLTDYGLDPKLALANLAARNYLAVDSYADAEAQTVWRQSLANNPLTAADSFGSPRPARQSRDLPLDDTTTGPLDLQPGGTAYIDLTLPAVPVGAEPRFVTVSLDSQADLRFWLLDWDKQSGYPNLESTSGPLPNGDVTVDLPGGDLTADLGASPRHVTLVVARVDVVADSGAATDDTKPATWTATVGALAPGVWAWGDNSWSSAGQPYPDRGFVPRPERVSAMENVRALTGGAYQGFAVIDDGIVWAWGNNDWGQLGDGSRTNASLPVQVALDDVTAIAAGESTTYALRSDGTVWSWGDGRNGALGNGTSTGTVYERGDPTQGSVTPVQVTGLTDVVSIAAGQNHGFAVRRDGSLWAWGFDGWSSLGDGSTQDELTPIQVPGISDVVSVTAGYQTTYALRADGTLWVWGRGLNGELGDGQYPQYDTQSNVPEQIQALTGVTDVAAGAGFALAVRSDGSVWGWGSNYYGQLTTAAPGRYNSLPVRLNGMPRATAVAAGSGTSYALSVDGSVWATGVNWSGELGIGSLTDTKTPVRVSRLSHVSQIAASWGNGYAVVPHH